MVLVVCAVAEVTVLLLLLLELLFDEDGDFLDLGAACDGGGESTSVVEEEEDRLGFNFGFLAFLVRSFSSSSEEGYGEI
jgi:hypothetical protein